MHRIAPKKIQAWTSTQLKKPFKIRERLLKKIIDRFFYYGTQIITDLDILLMMRADWIYRSFMAFECVLLGASYSIPHLLKSLNTPETNLSHLKISIWWPFNNKLLLASLVACYSIKDWNLYLNIFIISTSDNKELLIIRVSKSNIIHTTDMGINLCGFKEKGKNSYIGHHR